MKKQTVVILHGAYGSPQENWFPWLADQVQHFGHAAIVPTLPTPHGQSLDRWQGAFHAQVGELTPDMILIAHSIGAALALRLLENSAKPILGTFLASGFIGCLGNPDFDPLNASFFAKPFKWDVLRRNAGLVRVYNGDNDPYVPLQKGRELAANLNAELTVIKNGGHLNASAGFLKFDQLLSDLVKAFHWGTAQAPESTLSSS